MPSRRNWLIGGAALGAGGFWFSSSGPESSSVLGPPEVAGPLLRSALGGADRIFALVRRTETDQNLWGFLGIGGARRTRYELRAHDPANLQLDFASALISVEQADGLDARILGQRGTTIWVHIGGIAAVSAEDGRLLADPASLAASNGDLEGRIPAALDAFRFDGELEFTDTASRRWRIDARNFRAERVFTPQSRTDGGWAVPSNVRVEGLRQWEIGNAWFGLLDATQPGFDMRRLLHGTGERGGAQLWRARPLSPAAAASAGMESSRSVTVQSVSAGTIIMADPQRVAVADTPLHDASFLFDRWQGSGTTPPLRPPGPPALLLLYRLELGGALHLARIGPGGAIAWRTALGLRFLNSVLPGEPLLVLEGQAVGDTYRRLLVAVDALSGAVRSLDPAA